MTHYGRRPEIINKYFYGRASARAQPYGCFCPCWPTQLFRLGRPDVLNVESCSVLRACEASFCGHMLEARQRIPCVSCGGMSFV